MSVRIFQPVRSSKLSLNMGWLGAMAAVLALVLMLCPQKTFAQADQGAVVGIVTDSTGAVIPGAQVTLTDTDTGLVLKAKSNATGDYYFAPIKTGHYTVSVTAPGFETTEQQNIVVHVQDRLNIPIKLLPGNVSQTVTVTSAAPLMQTQTAETAVDFDSNFLNDAPLANRNFVFIAQETPGTTPFVGRGSGNGDFSSNGQHEEQNNYMLDGVDDNVSNSDFVNGSSYNVMPPPDAIAEVKMETSNYSAELGRGHGAVFNATTKSGTNEFHGDIWEYVRNTAFDSLVWTQAPGSKVAPFHMNQFGATLGGPILKNRLFFFGDIQDARYVNGASPSTYTVPTPRMRQGDFSELLNTSYTGGSCPTVLYVPNTDGGTGATTKSYVCSSNNMTTAPSGSLQQYGNQVTTDSGTNAHTNHTFAPGQNVFGPGQIDPVAQNILKLYPCPNYSPAGYANYGKPNGGWTAGNCNSSSDTDLGPTGSNYQVNLIEDSNPINWDGKLDWNISSRDLATFSVNYQHIINTFNAPLGPVLDGTGSYQGHNQTYLAEHYMLSETHTFSPTLINEFRFGFNFGNWGNLQYNYNQNIAATLGMNGVPVNTALQEGGLPTVSDGFTGFGTHGNDPAHEGMNLYQINDNLTKVVGNHSLKMGFEAMPQRWYSTNASQPLGSYSYGGGFTGLSGAGGPTGNSGADFLALGTLPGGGYTNTDNMNSASISTFTYTHFVLQYFAGYMQDDWKVTPKLTLNLGLRYEYFTPKREQSNQLANFVWENGSVTSNGAVGASKLVFPQAEAGLKLDPNLVALLNADNVQIAYTSNPYLSSFPKANWSPRVGAAYQIDSKTVARIGAGVFMGGFEPGGGAANILNPPFVMNASVPALPSCSAGQYCESQYAFNNTLEGGLGGFLAAGGIEHYATFPSIGEEDPTMHMPYTINYNLSLQRAFWSQTTATVSYVGSLGRHLVTGINNPDMPLAITIGGQTLNGLTPAPHFSGQFWMSWAGGSSYNSLQATVQKHYSNGLSFLGTYTLAHALDNTTDLLGGDIGAYKQAALIPIKYEWGQSGYDIRNRATIDVDYDLPFGLGRPLLNHSGLLDKLVGGWKTDMEWWAQAGQPFTVGISRPSGYQNANGGLSNSAIKIANPMHTGLPAPNQNNPLTASGLSATNAPSNTAANSCAAQTKTRQRWFNPCAFADPIGVINTSNATAIADLAPYATGSFSYYSPAVGADNALANGGYNTNGTTNSLGAVPYVTGYANVKSFFGSSKNDVSGPGNWRLNASLFKDFKTFREQYLEFRADAFNVLNHPSFGNPGSTNTNIGANAVALTGTMSEQNLTIDSRFLQFSGKYFF
jgi:Carboxypeptidase regulatory-like domain